MLKLLIIFYEFQHGIREFVLVGCRQGKKRHDILSEQLSRKGPRLRKPCSCFTGCSAPSSSLTLPSWIWMMLNPWEESCHVRHNCSIGKFLQTDPRTSLDNRMSNTGDSVSLYFNTQMHFLRQSTAFSFSQLYGRLIIHWGTVANGVWVKQMHCLIHYRWITLKAWQTM